MLRSVIRYLTPQYPFLALVSLVLAIFLWLWATKYRQSPKNPHIEEQEQETRHWQ
jgi:hypothetical protein